LENLKKASTAHVSVGSQRGLKAMRWRNGH